MNGASSLSAQWRFASVLVAAVWLAGPSGSIAADPPREGESFFFIPPGFDREGQTRTLNADEGATLRIVVRDAADGKPAPCRITVVGNDGNFYHPAENRLTPYSLTGEWPKAGAKGNRPEKAPWRYLGRFFYSTGETTIQVPAGKVRVEVSKGFEYRPVAKDVDVVQGKTSDIEISLRRTAPLRGEGYFGGDPHLHFIRATEADDQTNFDLLTAEDVWYGTPLGYNEPAGPYSGFMEKMDTPQFRGLGRDSIRTRGPISILSGQEYRSGQYGHLNLFLRDRLVFPGESFNADEWPVYGNVGAETLSQGGFAFHAHGGYALEIYADAALGTVSGVELLQFGIYRGIGLADWYHMLNSGYRFPCVGASDYPACRFLSDCRTYVWQAPSEQSKEQAPALPSFPEWLQGAAAGKSFVTNGPLLLLDVDGRQPGDTISHKAAVPVKHMIRARVRCEVVPVTTLDLIVNGEVVKSTAIPRDKQKGDWFTIEMPIELRASSWIAARAWSTTPGGQPDAESHTNPVYVEIGGRKPYRQASLDAWVQRIDGQIDKHRQRTFAKKAQVLDYFQRARDVLLKVRERHGLAAGEDPAQLAASLASTGNSSLAADLSQPAVTDEELREFLKPVPPRSPEEQVKSFETVAGFEMQLVAAEPLVFDPVAAAFDADGQLFVCEMRDYPYKPTGDTPPLGSIRLLRDTDGDGRFDEGHLFAENLLWAAGVAPWKKGVFVAAPPDIWYLEDTDGDFKADVRRRVFTGFGTGNQQAMLNNLTWGMDHWIYGSTAGNGGEIRPADQLDAPPVSVSGRDFRFDPQSGRFEAITGTVQFGNTFDDWGNRFVCSESQPLLQIVIPDHYLARNPFLASPHGIENLAPGPVPIFRTSPIERWRQIRSSRRIAKNERAAASPGASHHVIDAAAGVTIYRGGAWPPEFYGQAFVGDGQNNLVHRRSLTLDGITFRSNRVDEQTDFVRSSDIWFRPVNFINAPDGTLYCLDMSREVLESIHIPLDVVKHLDLKSGRDYGRIYRIAPPGFRSPAPPRLSKATTAELVASLESPHGWWRDTAHRLLFERQDPAAVDALRKLARHSTLPQARVLAIWSLHGLERLDDETCLAALADEHAGVRENVVRLVESKLASSQALLKATCALADDPVARVRYQIAFSLGAVDSAEATAALARIARRDAADRWIRTAVLSSCAERADRLFAILIASPIDAPVSMITAPLAEVVGVRNRPDETARVLQALAASPAGINPRLAQPFLLSLGQGLKRTGARLVPSNDDDAGSRLLRATLADAATTARAAEAPVEARVAAVTLLSCSPTEGHRLVLADLLGVDQPEPVQRAAVRALADDPDPTGGRLLLGRLQEFVPEIRRVALETLLSREDLALSLLEAAGRNEVSVSDVDSTRREFLLKSRSEQLRKLAQEVFGDAVDRSRRAVVTEYQAALKLKGDLTAGATVFQKNCSACHKVGGAGFAVGPNIVSSAVREPAVLLEHILDPNQYVLPNYLQYVVIDRQGRSHTGLLASQTATSVTLKKEKEETTTILRGDVEELVSSRKSLMPEGLEKEIAPQAMADLIAWLRQVSAEAPGDPNAERDFGTLPGLVEPAAR